MKQFRKILIFFLAAILLFSGCAQMSKEDVLPLVQTAGEIILELAQEEQTAEAPSEDAQAPPVEETIPERAMPEAEPAPEEEKLPEDGSYTSQKEVALYLHQYGHLPSNFITKKQAQKLGWEGGDLWKFAKGKSIGGDRFGNYEGVLPKGKNYKECDIDYTGGKRSGKRIVFSEDGCIYYTGDHYKSFTLLYGEE